MDAPGESVLTTAAMKEADEPPIANVYPWAELTRTASSDRLGPEDVAEAVAFGATRRSGQRAGSLRHCRFGSNRFCEPEA